MIVTKRLSLLLFFGLLAECLVPSKGYAKGLYASLGPSGTYLSYQGTSSSSTHLGFGFVLNFRMRYLLSRNLPTVRFEPFFEGSLLSTFSGSETQVLMSGHVGADIRLKPLILGGSVGVSSGRFVTGQAGTAIYLDPAVRLGISTEFSRTTGFMIVGSWHRANARFSNSGSITALNLDQFRIEFLYQFRLFGGIDP